GIITTDALYGATPAGFSAHANSRYDTADIIASQLQSGVNPFLGNGGSRYDAVDPSAYASHGYAHFSSYGSFIGTVTSLADGGRRPPHAPQHVREQVRRPRRRRAVLIVLEGNWSRSGCRRRLGDKGDTLPSYLVISIRSSC
ncbi:MAG: hypothetical protein LBT74_07360, partial [Acidobacteriota bacterium]|nr:hypothetical protein [Acidobacteriota bacterium]